VNPYLRIEDRNAERIDVAGGGIVGLE